MRFRRVPKPENFSRDAEEPGAQWLKSHPQARRPRDLWSPFKAALASGFRDLCAYSVMYEPVGTVDHFVSFHEDPSRAYDWTNYRFCSPWINASKQDVRADMLIDPFEVTDGVFEIILPSLQLVVAKDAPASCRARAEFVLNRLHLRDDERVIRQRRAWYGMYESGELTLDGLRKRAPLIARAVERQAPDAPTRSPSDSAHRGGRGPVFEGD